METKMNITEEYERAIKENDRSARIILEEIKGTLDSLVAGLQKEIFESSHNVYDLLREWELTHDKLRMLQKINDYFSTNYETELFRIKNKYEEPLLNPDYENKDKSRGKLIDLTDLLKEYHGKDLHLAVTKDYSKVVGTGKTMEDAIKAAEEAGYKDFILMRSPDDRLGNSI